MLTLRSLVEAALAEGSGSLEALVRSRMDASVDHAAWTRFLADYLWKAVESAEALAGVAAGHPLGARVQPFLDHIAAYAAEPEDAVPDSHGALGLLDDAYVVMVCIETLREMMNLAADQNLIAANTIVRALLGEAIDGRIRPVVEGIKQRVVIDTLFDLPAMLGLLAGAVMGRQMAMEIPTPVFTFPEQGAAPASGGAADAPGGVAVGPGATGAWLVGAWEYAELYSSSGFSASTYVTRVFGADGRFVARSRSQASQTSWAGMTGADTGAPPGERGRWSFEGSVLRLDYDNGASYVLRVSRGDGCHQTVPVAGDGFRKLWQRVG